MAYITLAIVHLNALLLLHRSLDVYSYKTNYMLFYFDQANIAMSIASYTHSYREFVYRDQPHATLLYTYTVTCV